MKNATLSRYDNLLERAFQSDEISNQSSITVNANKEQHCLVKGYIHKIQLRPGLSLEVSEFRNLSEENLIIAFNQAQEEFLTINFQLAGYCHIQVKEHNQEDYCEEAGISYLSFTNKEEIVREYPSNLSLTSVRIGVSCQFFEELDLAQPHSLPEEIQHLLDTNEDECFHHQIGIITASMKTALKFILTPPYQGFTQCLYLESKVLELIALQINQLSQSKQSTNNSRNLEIIDIEKVYQAKDILIRNMENPPSLLDLARQVGLNDYKLKRGFRQVFNTTAYQYLQNHRMEEAKILLSDRSLSIASVGRRLGYVSQSRFCDAFKKHVGMTPRDYKASQIL